MMDRQLVLIGINHKTAPVAVRECIAFLPEETTGALKQLYDIEEIREVMLYSTCNRVEVILVTKNGRRAIDKTKAFLSHYNQIPLDQFEETLYIHRDDEAVRHVFRVAASLDSLIVGEPQILGQMKAAYRQAIDAKTSGVILNRLLHRAFFVAKRIRTETGVGDRAVSISYAAVELARKIFGSLEGKKVLLIGAGEMAELAVEHLMRQKTDAVCVANRTFENAVMLADKFRGSAVGFDEIPQQLGEVDIIISSTGAPEIIITRDQVKSAVRARRNRPIFFIDIAVPRDIDPTIHRLSNSYVYDIDDLKDIVEENMEDRNAEAVKGERIVDEAVIHFRKWFESLAVVPTIVALREKIEQIVHAEATRTIQGLPGSSRTDEAIKKMSQAITNKFLHDPTLFLKRDGMHADKSVYIDVVRRMFKLDE
jgi:glutamyl-tRNA reductase